MHVPVPGANHKQTRDATKDIDDTRYKMGVESYTRRFGLKCPLQQLHQHRGILEIDVEQGIASNSSSAVSG